MIFSQTFSNIVRRRRKVWYNYSTVNLTWNALIFGLAVIIPGGLVVYFGWHAFKAYKNKLDPRIPTPEEAQAAFRAFYPRIK